MSIRETNDSNNNNCLDEKLKLSKTTDSSNLIEWFKNLELFLKSKVNIYSEVIETRKVPVEWLEYYIPSEEEEDIANTNKIKLKLLTQKMDKQANLVDGWTKAKYVIASFIHRFISPNSLTLIEDKFRATWVPAVATNDVVSMLNIAETAHLLPGKISTQRDKELVREKRIRLSLEKSKTLDNFIKDIQDTDKLIVSVGLSDIADTSSEDEDDTNFFKKSNYNFLAKPIKLKPVNNLSNCSDSNSKVSSDSYYSIDDVRNQKVFKKSLNGYHVYNSSFHPGMFSRDRKRGFVANLLIDSDDEGFNSDTDNNTTSNLVFKDNDSEHDDNNSINSIVENIDQIIDNDNNKGVEDFFYNILQSSDELTIPDIPLDYTKVHDSPVPPIISKTTYYTDIDPIQKIKKKDIPDEPYNVQHWNGVIKYLHPLYGLSEYYKLYKQYNVGSYLFNKYIETIHVSTIYVDDCLLHIYNKGVVTTSKVKGLFTVLLKKPGLPNPT